MVSSRIFIRGLPHTLTIEEFREHFSKQAPVTDAKYISNRRIGYVGYKTSDDALRAVKYYNKSFIRMSRISVELARPIEETNVSTPRASSGKSNKRNHTDFIKDLSQEQHPKIQTLLKHDFGEISKDEARLREFLEVMQPPSKSKVWKNQDGGPDQESEKLVSVGSTTSELQRDNEYELVPKKQKILAKANDPTKPSKSPAEFVDEASQLVENKNIAEIMATEPLQQLNNTEQRPSDADWLRSRTSRLLDLTDDDDATATNFPEACQGDQDTTTQNIKGSESKRGSNADHQIDKDDYVQPAIVCESEDTAVATGRLFIRNLTYTITEDDLRDHIESGGCGTIEEVHMPLDSRSGKNKGIAHIQFGESEAATKALRILDGTSFQGRLLHVMPAYVRKEVGLDEFAISKLPLKKQQQIRRRAEAATSTFNWNSLYMNADAVISSLSDRLGMSKAEVLDPTSSGAAVRQAHAETHLLQETKAYFANNGVMLDVFKRKEREDKALLVKNFSYGTTTEELRQLFEAYGSVSKILMPPAATIAIIAFYNSENCRSAFASLAYRKFKDSVLFLEKAPKGLFNQTGSRPHDETLASTGIGNSKPSAVEFYEGEETQQSTSSSTLFVRNLNFATTTERLREVFQPLVGFLSAKVKTKSDPKVPGRFLSMGFGFLEFRTKEDAQAALIAMNHYELDAHKLFIRGSHKAVDAAEERRRGDQAKKQAGKRTKIIIKNLPFEITKAEVRSLFGAYGQLRSVRVPTKFDNSTRGFAFADFVTAREAENAMNALRHTHLLGRRLALDFAAGDAEDPEQEIQKMQHKVGKQNDKVALQKLTGSGRKKFNVEGEDELDQA